jgi:hypothetical protein
MVPAHVCGCGRKSRDGPTPCLFADSCAPTRLLGALDDTSDDQMWRPLSDSGESMIIDVGSNDLFAIWHENSAVSANVT